MAQSYDRTGIDRGGTGISVVAVEDGGGIGSAPGADHQIVGRLTRGVGNHTVDGGGSGPPQAKRAGSTTASQGHIVQG